MTETDRDTGKSQTETSKNRKRHKPESAKDSQSQTETGRDRKRCKPQSDREAGL